MPDMTDPTVIRFVNEVVRPMAEQLRALRVRLDAAFVAWAAGLW